MTRGQQLAAERVIGALTVTGPMTGVDLLDRGVSDVAGTIARLEAAGWLIDRHGNHPNTLTMRYTLRGRAD